MENLCPKVGKLGSLLEGDSIERDRMWDNSGIRAQNPIDILPDLDFIQIQGSTNRSRRQIGATASERRDLSVRVVTNKPGDDSNNVGIDATFERISNGRFVFGKELGVPKVAVGEDSDSPRIKGLGGNPNLVETRGHDSHAASFSVRNQLIEGFGTQFLDHLDARQHLFALVQQLVHGRSGGRLFVDFQSVHCSNVQRANRIDADLSLEGEFSSAQEIVGCLSHCTTHNGTRSVSLFDLRFDEVCDVVDTFGIGER
mmetsp:Transcript_17818/g.44461  ORF Transcript_17818/g.44461 Transcript_17818/m.44461 type:complete len:256 (-) Transcript_17818:342-1109(-)